MSWPILYAILGLMVLFIGWQLGWIADSGGYKSTWSSPDKNRHAAAALILQLMAGYVMTIWVAAAITWLLGLGWELAQRNPRYWRRTASKGFMDPKDLVMNTIGIALGIVWQWLVL